MGTGIKITCTHCGHAQSIMLGVGMMYSSLESVIDLVHPASQHEVHSILQTHDVERVEYEHALFACPACRTLEGHFFYEIEYGHGKVLRSEFQCARCGKNLVRAKENIETYRCSLCGEQELVEEFELLWD